MSAPSSSSPGASPAPLVTLHDVSYLYPRAEEPALRDVSLTIQPGELLGLVGPTGAGKSTLCLSLGGIVPQFFGGRFFGTVTVAGHDTLHLPISALFRHVAMVFEDPETQLIATSVEAEIAFALENLKVPRDEIRARIPRVLEAVRLDKLAHKAPAELSGGQKQRLAIAAALATQPQLLILDEPTSQLDPTGAAEIFATVRECNKTLGIAVVLVSHAAEELAEHADRIALLSRGELRALGTPNEVYSQVELLTRNDVRPPQVVTTFHLLRERGVKLESPSLPITLETGSAALAQLVATRPDLTLAPPANQTDAINENTPPVIEASELKYQYPDGTPALRGVSLRIHRGEYVALIGQNGAGKSTLLKHFLKLLRPHGGTLRVNGTDADKLDASDLSRRIGYVAQNPDLQIFNASVEDEVAFALRHLGYDDSEIEARVESSLEAMGLLQARKAHPLSLPRGHRARVVIAAVLAMHPDTIIFDEPTIGQDDAGAHRILDMTKKLHEQGKTILVVTHHLHLMPPYARRVVVMGEGGVLLDAPLRTAFHDVAALARTHLVPPQAVLLSRELERLTGQRAPLLTPEELAACLTMEKAA